MVNEKPANLVIGDEAIFSFTFKICGLTMAEVDELLAHVELGDYARFSIIDRYPDLGLCLAIAKRGEQQSPQLCDQVRAVLGAHIYAEGERTLEEVVGALLLAKQRTLALAESCTGGYVSHRITRVAGSSAYYYGGVVTYSNEAKMLFLGVGRETLERHGAVSRETALEMSQGIRERTGASIGLSVTGVAGPSGGSAEKPVGTVWISMDCENCHDARRFQFHGERERIIMASSQAALDWLRRSLL